MNKNRKNIILLLSLILILKICGISYAEEKPRRGNIAVFFVPQKRIKIDAVSANTRNKIIGILNELGRFLPVEKNRERWAFENIYADNINDYYRKAAELLEVDLYVLITVFKTGNGFYGKIETIPLNKEFSKFKKNIVVQSKIANNVALKAAKEMAYLHENIKLKASVIKKVNDHYLINVGQWHGIKPKQYKTVDGRRLTVFKTEMYRSYADFSFSAVQGDSFIIKESPKIKKVLKAIEKNIDHNLELKYGLKNTVLKNDDDEKKFAKALLINLPASLVIPGYGAHLTVGYMELKEKPSITGIVLSATMILGHFLVPSFMTSFKAHFFPWVMDNDKTKNIQDLQIFLWATLPVTYSVSFIDQFAHQLEKSKHLPPYFRYKDKAALFLSFIIPGGGLFYKGYRVAGWSYYISEMVLAGYAVYNGKNKNLAYILAALGTIKIAELFNAYFIKPSYGLYKSEHKRKIDKPSFSFGINNFHNYEPIFRMSLTYQF